MSDSSSKDTTQKIHSLRIDPDHKQPRRRSRGGLILGVLIGLLLGIAGMLIFNNQNIQPSAPGKTPYRPAQTPKAGAVGNANSGDADPGAAAAGASSTTASTTASQSAGDAPAPSTLLAANGYITPRHRIALSPRVMGLVAWVGIEKGDLVKKDQVLVRLKDDDYRAQVKQAEARLVSAHARLAELEAGSRPEEIERAKADLRAAEAALKNADLQLDRRKTLVEIGRVDPRATLDDAQAARDQALARRDAAKHTLDLLVAGPRKEQLDAARAEADSAKAALDYATILLEDTVIRAPIDGTVLEKLIEPGELVSPQSFGGTRGARTELLSLANLAQLQVEVDVNESDFAKIRMGQPARVTLDAYPDRAYSARVREIAPEANRQKATVQIKVEILDPDARVLPEMNARVDFLAETARP